MKRPYITLKWAQTSDGYIDVVRSGGSALNISTPVSQAAVHKLRAMHDAILVGTRTAILDNPSLNLRCWAGRSPLRLVIDRGAVLPASLALFDGSVPTVVYTACEDAAKCGKNIEQVVLDFSKPVLPGILEHLHSSGVNSLLVEGGSKLLQSFIDAGLWDAVRVEINENLVVGSGVPAPVFSPISAWEVSSCGGNKILYCRK